MGRADEDLGSKETVSLCYFAVNESNRVPVLVTNSGHQGPATYYSTLFIPPSFHTRDGDLHSVRTNGASNKFFESQKPVAVCIVRRRRVRQ